MSSIVKFSHKMLLILLLAFALLGSLLLGAFNHAEAAEKKFSDFRAGDGGYEEVMSLVEKGVVNGYGNGTFKPYNNISREHVALMLSDALQLETPENLPELLANYKDIDKNYEYAGQIAAVTKAGIFKGDSGQFHPKNSINRAEMGTVLVRAFQLTGNDSPVELIDIDKVAASHKKNVEILAQNGITIGKKNNEGKYYFDGKGHLNRVQFSMMLDRAMHVGGTIDSISKDKITISGYEYTLAKSVSEILNEENADVLKDAKVTFESNRNQITKAIDLELNHNGTSSNKVVLDGNSNKVYGHLTVNANHVTLKNVEILGNLTILGENVDVDNVTVKGNTIVGDEAPITLSNVNAAADSNSVTFNNSTIGKLVINQKGTNVEIKGSSLIDEVVIEQNATVTADGNTTVSAITVSSNAGCILQVIST